MVYTTLLGEQVDLGKIPGNYRELVGRLMSLKGQMEAQPFRKFRDSAMREIRRQFQINRDYYRAMNGPVGIIYRDCFYRFVLEDAEAFFSTTEARERFVQSIRFNPLRVLVDCFICFWDNQSEFATAAGLDTSTVSRIFKSVLEPESGQPSGLSLVRFRDVCERLGIIFTHQHLDENAEYADFPLDFKPSNVTSRERNIQTLMATVAKAWTAVESTGQHLNEKVRIMFLKFVGLHLAALYGVEDAVVLDLMANAFLKEVKTIHTEQALSRVLAIEISLGPELDQLCESPLEEDSRDKIVQAYRRLVARLQHTDE